MTAAAGAAVGYLVYGKIIIDDIRRPDGSVVRGVLGGGGPQALFGAALWEPSVGFLSRSGSDIEAHFAEQLGAMGADLAGWQRFPDIPTLRGHLMDYDQDEYMVSGDPQGPVILRQANWEQLLARELALPAHYREAPRAIHLITEYADEPMVRQAMALRARGAILSLEPLIDFHAWSNRDALLDLIRQVDIVTPDWPSASAIAGSERPSEVLRHWSTLGPEAVAVRHGARGSYVWSRGAGRGWHVPALPVSAVDPTGAGNAYGGGWMVGWARHGDGVSAACHGGVSASFVVEQVGLPGLTGALRTEASERLRQQRSLVRPL